MKLVVLGLSITSSWGNGHATTYRGLLREFAARGHEVLFLERDVPWYSASRDMPSCEFAEIGLYDDLEDLRKRYESRIATADAVIVGSYVPEGVAVGRYALSIANCPVLFYDIDTPVTLAKLEQGDFEYIDYDLIKRYSAYLSFSGGPVLDQLQQMGSPLALPLYCSFDPALYYPERVPKTIDLGYLGTYSDDRQPTVAELLLEPAKVLPEGRFSVAGPQYPGGIEWPRNVSRIEHLAPEEHRAFYCSQRFTLNVTRAAMIKAGYSPSVRLFEAAACGVPIISDYWEGLDSFFELGSEILVARSSEDVVEILMEMPEVDRERMANKARHRVMASHTAANRAEELEAALATAGRSSPLIKK